MRCFYFSVSKKSNYKFRHAGILLRNGVEFRILRGKMYEGTSTEQKVKNAKNKLNSMFNLFLYPLSFASLNSVSPPGSVGASALSCRGLHRRPAPLTIRGAIYILFWRVSAHFIDSLKGCLFDSLLLCDIVR